MSANNENGLREAIGNALTIGQVQGRAKVALRSGRPQNSLYRTSSPAWMAPSHPVERLVWTHVQEAVTSAYVAGFEAGVNAPKTGGKRKTRRSRK